MMGVKARVSLMMVRQKCVEFVRVGRRASGRVSGGVTAVHALRFAHWCPSYARKGERGWHNFVGKEQRMD